MIFRKNENIEVTIDKEDLTSLLSIETFKEQCEDLFKKTNLQKSIFIIKIDNYRELSESYSYSALKEIQLSVAKLIQGSSYLAQNTAHLEEDKFICLAKGLNSGMALTVAKLLLTSVKNKRSNVVNKDGTVTTLSVTASIGLYNVTELDSIDTAINNANSALTTAIEKEGNQVCTYEKEWSFLS
ncbi:MAG: diguanylate cyclase [Erysipelotrichaceae bacterium]